MAKPITKAKLQKVTKTKAKPKAKLKPKVEVKADILPLTPQQILKGLEDRALAALKIGDHLHAIAAEILNGDTARRTRTQLYFEFRDVLEMAPANVRAEVIEELEFMLKEPESDKDTLPMQQLDDARKANAATDAAQDERGILINDLK